MKHCGSITLRKEWKFQSGEETKTQTGGQNIYCHWDLTPTTHSATILSNTALLWTIAPIPQSGTEDAT